MNITSNLKITKNKQPGFTLIELMISIVIGLIVLAAVIGMFVSMVKSDNDNLKAIRLNHELRAAMSLITRDIRRAGANQNAAVNSSTTPPTNPFSSTTGPVTRVTIAGGGSSISFSYDAVSDAVIELYGFQRNSTAGNERIESCSGSTATGCGIWQPVTDESFVNITNLAFTDTTVPQNGVNIREITVTLSGQLRSDPSVTRTLTETVKVRNDEI
jgi:prepilin peptidase dependent protein B